MITNIVPTLRGLHFSQEEIASAIKDKKLLRHIKSELKEPCKSCKIDCYGCRGNAYSLCKDFLAPDLSCWRVENVTTNPKS